jgi:hypothetical protein
VAGWNEASVDELLADPIVRDVMAADGVAPSELRALLYGVQRTIETYAASQGRPTALARFAKLCSMRGRANAVRTTLPANRGRPDVRKSRIGPTDCSTLSTARLGSRSVKCAAMPGAEQ